MQYAQNDAAKDRLLFLSRSNSIDVMIFTKRVEKNPNVVLYKKAHAFAWKLVQERWKSV